MMRRTTLDRNDLGEGSAALAASGRFAANLKRLRQAAGLSQEELAFRSDIHRTHVSFIEGGHRLPRLDTLVKLAGALYVTPNDLLEGIAWEPSFHRPGRFIPGVEEARGDVEPRSASPMVPETAKKKGDSDGTDDA